MKYISDLNSLPPSLQTLIRRNHSREDKISNKTLKSKHPKLTVSLKLHHPVAKSRKHETIQRFSKFLNKPPVLNATTKHTFSTTPAMRLVTHNQGSRCSHGSFEDLSNILRQDRRQVARKDILTKKGHESLQMVHSHFCETLGSSPDPTLLTVWEHYRKSSINQSID